MICRDCAVQDHKICVDGTAKMLYPPCDCQHRERVTHGKIDSPVKVPVPIAVLDAVEHGARYSQSAADVDSESNSTHTKQASDNNSSLVQGAGLSTETEENIRTVASVKI